MKILILDCETSGAPKNKGHPFDKDNKLCYIGYKERGVKDVVLHDIEYSDGPYGRKLQEVQTFGRTCNLVVGANYKYDLHWLRRYGVDLGDCRVFDVSVAFFILRGQRGSYPSLDGMAEYYGVSRKLDIVKTEYWNKGVDTPDVPREILEEYLTQDLITTEEVFDKVIEEVENSSYELQQTIKFAMLDLEVLEEMEYNGMLYSKDESISEGNKLVEEIASIDEQIEYETGLFWLSINSNEHKSVLLFGGTVVIKEKVPYVFTYKDGRTANKERWEEIEYSFNGFFDPKKEKVNPLAKEGFYSTDEGTLRSLSFKAKGEGKKLIEQLLYRAKLEKRRSTYYHGIPNKMEEFNWKDNIVHHSLNQVVAVTGRLSSSKPNLQNTEEQVKRMFISRF